ncbi:hypothetical protein B0H94_11627 [Salsuginibacillus halophilus]|uniref:Uncharacterized protein n=1 Tax=Salsuginibacillus halophilus TaxID=517424 RepID=A0A2P8H801_9BACI|nr:hypothetical protein [Salsuginibacillus halophilus]PSL42324.1 hypothetical protein B0H94_11627 [Salsuginibacillus halophilus]
MLNLCIVAAALGALSGSQRTWQPQTMIGIFLCMAVIFYYVGYLASDYAAFGWLQLAAQVMFTIFLVVLILLLFLYAGDDVTLFHQNGSLIWIAAASLMLLNSFMISGLVPHGLALLFILLLFLGGLLFGLYLQENLYHVVNRTRIKHLLPLLIFVVGVVLQLV